MHVVKDKYWADKTCALAAPKEEAVMERIVERR